MFKPHRAAPFLLLCSLTALIGCGSVRRSVKRLPLHHFRTLESRECGEYRPGDDFAEQPAFESEISSIPPPAAAESAAGEPVTSPDVPDVPAIPADPEPAITNFLTWNSASFAVFGPMKSSVELKPWGKAQILKNGMMDVTNGAFVIPDLPTALLNAAKTSNQLTLEIAFQSAGRNQQGPARILSFSTDSSSRNFTLGQEQSALILRLRTSKNDLNGTRPEIKLTVIPEAQLTHMVVTYRDGLLQCYVNGEEVLSTDQLRGDFSNWTEQRLLLGDEWNRGRNWDGVIQSVAVATEFADPQEVKRRFEAWRKSRSQEAKERDSK